MTCRRVLVRNASDSKVLKRTCVPRNCPEAGRRHRLPHQSFRVLAMLLDKAGQLVTREELRARLWPAGTLVEYDQD